MSLRFLITSPADLGTMFATKAAACRATADTITVKSIAREWRVKADVYDECARIAMASTIEPEREEPTDDV